MNSRLACSIVRASACRCGARIGQKCADRFGVPLAPHPDRQKRAADRFPAIAEALAAAAASLRLAEPSGSAAAAADVEQASAPVPAVRRMRRPLLTRCQLENASELQGIKPLYLIARRYHVAAATLSNYLKQAGLFKQDTGRDEHGRFRKGNSGNLKGRPVRHRGEKHSVGLVASPRQPMQIS